MACDLLNGVKSWSPYNKTSSELYKPHSLAWLLGLVQEIPLSYDYYVKFDEQASLYANKLANWEWSSNEKMNNFHFEKFRLATSTTSEFPLWWEVVFKKCRNVPGGHRNEKQ